MLIATLRLLVPEYVMVSFASGPTRVAVYTPGFVIVSVQLSNVPTVEPLVSKTFKDQVPLIVAPFKAKEPILAVL